MKRIITAILLTSTVFLTGCARVKSLFSTGVGKGNSEYSTNNASNRALVALVKGNYAVADTYANDALQTNSNDPYALLVSGITNERLGRPNISVERYKALLAGNAKEPIMLKDFKIIEPSTTSDIAAERIERVNQKLKVYSLKTDDKGEIGFNVDEGIEREGDSSKSNELNSDKQLMNHNLKGIGVSSELSPELFKPEDSNAVMRFMVMKTLMEKGLVQKEEFESRREKNVGALLPYSTAEAPSAGLERPVPSSDKIIERVDSMRNMVEQNQISSDEFQSGRMLILEALLPLEPKIKAAKIKSPKGLLEAADTVRRLQVLKDLSLITQAEFDKEKEIIEKGVRLSANSEDEVASSLPPNKPEQQLGPKVLVKGLKEPTAAAESLASGDKEEDKGSNGAVDVEFGDEDLSFGAQLASYRDKSLAEQGWNLIVKDNNNLLKDVPYKVIKIQIPSKGIFYRLVAAPLSNAGANNICNELVLTGSSCVVIKM